MLLDDTVHGPTDVTEQVLLDLLGMHAVGRLRGVYQSGITALLGVTRPVTRYDHSVGTMLLVRRLGGSLREQVAALLHDVSHTAFSHVVDHVFETAGDGSFHETAKPGYVAASDLPVTLGRHGLDWREFLSDEPFPLLEQPQPRLCADRLDYFLRDGSALGLLTPGEVRATLGALVVRDGRICLDGVESAWLVGDRYLAADEASWSNPHELVLYGLAARAIRAALRAGVLSEVDLWGVDAEVWERLRTSGNADVTHWVGLAERRPGFIHDATAPTLRVRTRARAVDPDVATAAGVHPLSSLDGGFRDRREAYLRRKSADLTVRLLD